MRIALPPTDGVIDTESNTDGDGSEFHEDQQPTESCGDEKQENGDEDSIECEYEQGDSKKDDSIHVPEDWLTPDKPPLDAGNLNDITTAPGTGGQSRPGGETEFGKSSDFANTTSDSSKNWKRMLVVGDGATKHDYEIGMEKGGEMRKATHAGANDSKGWNDSGNQVVVGELWHWNADSYAFRGEIAYIRADGGVAVHAPGGIFTSASRIHIDGRADGMHRYELGINNADLKKVDSTTESTDIDHGGNEKRHTADYISGEIGGRRHDSYDLSAGDPLQYVAVKQGQLGISR